MATTEPARSAGREAGRCSEVVENVEHWAGPAHTAGDRHAAPVATTYAHGMIVEEPYRSRGSTLDEGALRLATPGLPDGALSPDYVGIRPKIHGPDEPQPDFRVDGPEMHGIEGLVTLFGIESPGLTSSLAIGEAVSAKLP